MALTSEINSGLNDISKAIRAERKALIDAKARVTTAKNTLDSLTTQYSDVINTIVRYGDGGDVYQKSAIAEKDKLISELVSLRDKSIIAETDLGAIDFTV